MLESHRLGEDGEALRGALNFAEDLPLVSVAVDTRARIEAALRDVHELRFSGLVTLERARMLTGGIGAVTLPPELNAATKLTVYVGRHETVGSRPAMSRWSIC